MRAIKLVFAGAIGLAACDAAEQDDLAVDVTGAADTDDDTGTADSEPDSESEVGEPGASPGAGACPATHLVDEPEEAAIRTLTSDATHLYYVLWPCELDDCPSDVDEVRALPKAGGTPTILAFEPGSITDNLVLAAGHLYWIRNSDHAIMRVPTDACEGPEVVLPGPAARMFLSANADGLYWRSLDDNELWTRLERVPLEGGDVETVATELPDATFALLDDERLYFRSGTSPPDSLLNALDLETGEREALIANPESFGGQFTQDAVALQWSTGTGLRRLAKSGGEPVTIVDEGNYDVGSNGELALYFAFDGEELRAVPVTGGASTLVAPSTCNLFGTWLERVVDADRFYWSSGDDIYTVPLPP